MKTGLSREGAMAGVNYSKLRVLIIEDFANFSSALRMMLSQFGVLEIEIAISGEKALPLMKANAFDIVLSDFNLGEGRNGNDVLEEAKQNKLLKSDCIYIMITAENTTDMVMGALEFQPDEYLTKPFNKDVLLARLERLLRRREALLPIFKAIDKSNMLDAIAQCDSLAPEHPRYKSYLLKLKTDLLLEQGNYDGCRDIYQQILMVKFIPWAQLGLGKSFFYQGQYDKAEKAFRQLLSVNRGYVHGWDWLARCQEKVDDLQGAQESLATAAKISPINVSRQSRLGQLALNNGDLEQAERALLRSVKVGKFSINRSPENYLQLATVISQRVTDVDAVTAKRMEKKVMLVMDELRTSYRGDRTIALQSRLAEKQVYDAQGNDSEAEHALMLAFDLCKKDQDGSIPLEFKEHLIEQLDQAGKADFAGEVVSQMQGEESVRNSEAAELYSKGEVSNALVVLQLAIEEKPRSFAINLNLAQVAMHHMVQTHIDPALMQQVGEALDRVSSLPSDSKRFKVYQDLKARFATLQKKLNKG
tara:strand:+ start:751 stop:2346 length:1596 start_codon:yes stop_codon:yes gene_type:complete